MLINGCHEQPHASVPQQDTAANMPEPHRAGKFEADAGHAAFVRERLAAQLAERQHDVLEVQRACYRFHSASVQQASTQV